jgi:RNase P subunit RPR2
MSKRIQIQNLHKIYEASDRKMKIATRDEDDYYSIICELPEYPLISFKLFKYATENNMLLIRCDNCGNSTNNSSDRYIPISVIGDMVQFIKFLRSLCISSKISD